ncbi:MAG: alcohol dehydrogenase [Chloroflexi bacterium]|nr:MAG: alcohol dehydrogenase [Chloroflexota bacterium]
MKQAIMTAPGQIEIRQTQAPVAGPGEVLLRIQRIGVCGSDVHVFHGKHPYTSYPVVQGHEFSAIVLGLGAGVTGLEVGSKVTSMPQLVCGVCPPCRRGDYHICDSLKVQGFQAPGCAQELWVTSAEKIIPLPDNFSFEEGAMVEPVSVAVHSTSRAGDLSGKNVAVLGAGPIGNLIAQVARAAGAKVLLTDLSEYRLELAQQCGLENVSNAGKESLREASRRVFGDQGFSVALECVGVESTMTAAIETIEKGGTIIVVGVFGEKPRVDLGLVQDRELNLRGTLMYKREDYEKAAQVRDALKNLKTSE